MYALYISPMGAGSDMSHVVAGLVTELNRAGLKTTSFKPIGGGVSTESAAQLLSTGGNDQLMEDIIGAYYTAAGNSDVVVIEGVVNDFAQAGALAPYAAQLNAELVRNIQADVVFVAANAEQVEQYRASDEAKRGKMFGFFVGQAMKASKGKANPGQVNELLKKKLES